MKLLACDNLEVIGSEFKNMSHLKGKTLNKLLCSLADQEYSLRIDQVDLTYMQVKNCTYK